MLRATSIATAAPAPMPTATAPQCPEEGDTKSSSALPVSVPTPTARPTVRANFHRGRSDENGDLLSIEIRSVLFPVPCRLAGQGYFFSTRTQTSSMLRPVLSFPVWCHLFPSIFQWNDCGLPLSALSISSSTPYSGTSSYVWPFSV